MSDLTTTSTPAPSTPDPLALLPYNEVRLLLKYREMVAKRRGMLVVAVDGPCTVFWKASQDGRMEAP